MQTTFNTSCVRYKRPGRINSVRSLVWLLINPVRSLVSTLFVLSHVNPVRSLVWLFSPVRSLVINPVDYLVWLLYQPCSLSPMVVLHGARMQPFRTRTFALHVQASFILLSDLTLPVALYMYRGTSLIRNRPHLRPYNRICVGLNGGPGGGGCLFMSEVPLYMSVQRKQPHMQTPVIYKLSFIQNYYTCGLILQVKIVLCNKSPQTKFINYK